MAKVSGPDFTQGVAAKDVKPGSPLLGHVGESGVLLANLGDAFSAVSAECTHYHGPLAEGLVVGESVRCPWHHACFSLRNGEVLAAPGLNPLQRWKVEQQGEQLLVREKLPVLTGVARKPPAGAKHPESVIIVGGGAAGEAAATTLRFRGYKGPVTIISAEAGLPPDRPNLSKDYLAGSAPAAWVPVRSETHFKQHDITLLLNTRVESIDAAKKTLRTHDGKEHSFGALLLATGAEPVKLPTPGADQSHVHYLRTLADSESIIKAVEAGAKRAVVIGASFIGLEVAASLRTRGLEVHVVGPEARPLERVLGPQLGDFVRGLHEKKGVNFHLGQTVSVIGKSDVTLSGGGKLGADLVVIGVGVRPVTALAEQLGLKLDKGVVVDAHLETSVPGIYAAGDIARWPDPRSGAIRVEHWAVAQRQGQTAARNMLGFKEAFDSVPFFWSQHYDVAINYVGHAEKWDEIVVDGDPEKLDCAVSYKQGGRLLALATIYRDKQSLKCAAELAGD